jgi:hypothetical protein
MKKASAHLKWIQENIHSQTDLGSLVRKMEHRGFGLLMFIFAVPFIQPVPTAGLSTALGALILLMGVQLSLRRRSVWLPGWIERKIIDEKTARFLIRAAEKFFAFIEKFIHPRLSLFCKSELLIGILIAGMAALLMLPIPLPLSNSLCAIPIALWALALVEEDGLMSAIAFVFALAALVFHGFVFYLLIRFGEEAIPRIWDYFL